MQRGLLHVVLATLLVCQGTEGKIFEVFTMDCKGQMHFLNSLPLGSSIAVDGLSSMADHMWEKVKDRIKCKCPQQGMSDDEFARKYMANGIINMMMGDATVSQSGPYADVAEACPGTNDIADLGFLSNAFKIDLPSTCQSKDYASKGCAIKIPSSTGKWRSDIIVAAKNCPNSKFPFLTVAIEGGGMNDMLKPCASDATCSSTGLTCIDMSKARPFGVSSFGFILSPEEPNVTPLDALGDRFFKLLDSMNFYDVEVDGTSRTCYNIDTFFQAARTFLLSWMFGSSDTASGASSFKFCGSKDVFLPKDVSFDAENFFDKQWGVGWQLKDRIAPGSGRFLHMFSNNTDDSWNGKLEDGTDVFAPNRMDGSAFISAPLTPPRAQPGQLNLFGFTCDLSAYFQLGRPDPASGGKGLGAMLRFKNISPLIDFASKQMWDFQVCRFKDSLGASFTLDTFFKLFQVWSPYMYLNAYTSSPSSSPGDTNRTAFAMSLLGGKGRRNPFSASGYGSIPWLYSEPGFRDARFVKLAGSNWTGDECCYRWMEYYYDNAGRIIYPNRDLVPGDHFKLEYSLSDAKDYRLKMPSTCSKEEYFKNRRCMLKYTGLTYLFGLPSDAMDVIGSFAECPATSSGLTWPHFNLSIKGTSAMSFSPLRPCAKASDCSSGTTCTNIDFLAQLPDLINLLVFGAMEGPESASDSSGGAQQCGKYTRPPAGQTKSQLAADIVSYLTGGTDPGNTAGSFSFCLPPNDISTIANRAGGMALQTEKDVDLQSFSEPSSSSMKYWEWMTNYYKNQYGVQSFLLKPLQLRRSTIEIKNLLNYYPPVPSPKPSETPAPVTEVELQLEVNVPVTLTGAVALDIPSLTSGGQKTKVVVNFGKDKVDVVTSSEGTVTFSFDSGTKISFTSGEVDPSQLVFAGKQEKSVTLSISPIGKDQVAASDAVVFGATPPLKCNLSLKIASQRRATMGYRLHWLNKYDNTWVPLCSEHTVDSAAGDVSASLSAQVQGDPRFNPLSPDKCHEKLKTSCTESSGGVLTSGGVLMAFEEPAGNIPSACIADNSLGVGAIVGIVIGSIVFCAAVGGGACLFVRSQCKNEAADHVAGPSEQGPSEPGIQQRVRLGSELAFVGSAPDLVQEDARAKGEDMRASQPRSIGSAVTAQLPIEVVKPAQWESAQQKTGPASPLYPIFPHPGPAGSALSEHVEAGEARRPVAS